MVTRAVVTEPVPLEVEEPLPGLFLTGQGQVTFTQPSRSLLGEEKPKMLINCVTCHFALGGYVGCNLSDRNLTPHPERWSHCDNDDGKSCHLLSLTNVPVTAL